MSDNQELLAAINKQAEENDSLDSLATWIGDQLPEPPPQPQEAPAGAIGDRTSRPGVGAPDTVEDLARYIGAQFADD